jgi:hypothetical protein
VQELEYAENGTFKRYSGYDLLNISPSDVMTSAEFDYKQAAVAVTISASSSSRTPARTPVIDLLGARIKNAEKTIMNNIALGLLLGRHRGRRAPDRRPPAPRLLDPDHGHGRRHQRRDLVVLAERVLGR